MEKKVKLSNTGTYLLLIDEEASIDINTYIVAKDLSGIAKVKEYKKGHILAIDIFQNTELGISYHQTSECNKIIAYYPLTKEGKELDLPLLPNPFEEKINIEILALKDLNKRNKNFDSISRPDLKSNLDYENGYLDGAKFGVAQSHSKQFSLEDMKKAFEVGRNFQLTGEDNFNEFIQSLSTQQLPVSFELEIEQYTQNYHKDIWYNRIKTITNSQGKEILQGKYIW